MPGALPIALALSLAARVAPGVAPDTLVTFAQQESGLRPFAIHDNSTGRSYAPDTREKAESLASVLILRLGHSVDLGLLQINYKGPERRGMPLRDAFDPAQSMRTGAAILTEAWQACPGHAAALRMRCAAERYNGGSANGSPAYGARIFRTAAQIVPSITRIVSDFPDAAPGGATDTRPTTGTADITGATKPDPNGWDVFAQAGGDQQFVFTGNH